MVIKKQHSKNGWALMSFNNKKCIKSLLVIIALLVAIIYINNKGEVVEVYSIDMMYACGECTTYKVFGTERGKFLYRNDSFESNGQDKAFLLKSKMARVEGNDIKKGQLVGREFNLTFDNDKERNDFESVEGKIKYPACYVFYFKGEWGGEYKWFFDYHNMLNVKSYKIIPVKNCMYISNRAVVNNHNESDEL